MRFIENADLREWVKDNLRKSIFQKAHALAVQTGCEILVKLDDEIDTKSSHYYATTLLQHAFKHNGVREKPGDKPVCGETGRPIRPTVDSAVQIGISEYEVNGVVALDSTSESVTDCNARLHDTDNADSNNIIPLHLIATNEERASPSPSQRHQGSSVRSGSTSSTNEQTDVVLDFSLKSSQEETKTKVEETSMPALESQEISSNSIAMETDQSSIVALLQRPSLLPTDSERHKCQICSRNFPKQQLLRDHVSRSHMQPNMSLVMQTQTAQSVSLEPVPSVDLDHVPSQSPTSFGSPLADSSLGKFTYPATLPTFTSAVQAALTDGSIYQVWDLFIREVTDFYFHDMPQEDGKARLAYQHIGKTMYEKYPCIRSEGQTPWSHFNKSLSAKIRWRRQKRKFQDPGGGVGISGSRPAKRPNSTPSPSGSSPSDEIPPVLSPHRDEDVDVKPDINQLNRQILLAQQQVTSKLQAALAGVVHLPPDGPGILRLTSPSSEPSTSAGMVSPPPMDYGIPTKGLKKNILMQTGFYLTPELAAMGFSSTLKMTAERVKPLLKQMSKEGYGIWVEDPVNKDKCGFIKWYPLNEKQQAEVNLTNEQYKRACVAKPQTPRMLSREMEQFFDAYGGRKVRQNMSLL